MNDQEKELKDTILPQFNRDRANVVPILQKVQGKWGYLSKESIYQISRFLGITENVVFGVATFYAQFRFTPPADHSIRVCFGTACYVRGTERVLDKLKEKLKIHVGETTEDRKFSINVIRCLGCCAIAPVMMIDEEIYGALTPKKAINVLNKYAPVSIAESPAEEVEITGKES
jgi:NADH:ubiquinone oxidoreductase subunit E